MKLLPPQKVVALAKAKPGELVRVMQTKNREVLGIIALQGERTTLACLQATPQPLIKPEYCSIPLGSSLLALSYGQDYAFHVARNARMVTSDLQHSETSGAMLIDEGRSSIRLAQGGAGYDGLDRFYDIGTGALLDNGDWILGCLALLDWEIRLNSSPADDPPLFRFNAP